MYKLWVLIPSMFAFTLTVTGQERNVDYSPPEFSLFHEFGVLEKAISNNVTPIKDQWVHRSGAWLNFKATKDDRIKFNALIGGVYWAPTLETSDRATKTRFFAGSVPRFEVSYLFGDLEEPDWVLTGGIFSYKYNENSRNLGEYMFRTGAYPNWISTGGLTYVGTSGATLTGTRLQHIPSDMFRHELIMDFETQILPQNDLHLTYMTHLDFGGFLKMKAGLQAVRLVSLRPSKTNPTMSLNSYFTHNGVDYVNDYEYYAALKDGYEQNGLDVTGIDQAVAVLDSIADSTLIVPMQHYKANGWKPIVSMAFDPKVFIPGDIFGPNDLVLYGETALLGVENYPIYYENRAERMPVMVGFNIPTFKLMKVLAIEVERYTSKFPNSVKTVQDRVLPQPTVPPSGGYFPADWTSDDIKWTLYGEVDIFNGLALSGLVGKDHARGWEWPTGKTDWSLMLDDSHWYWMMRLSVKI